MLAPTLLAVVWLAAPPPPPEGPPADPPPVAAPSERQEEQSEPPANLLAGPAVDAAREATIVERDYAGRMRPLEITPEEAALERMDLPAGAREAAVGVLAARAAILDRVVRENIDLLTRLATAAESRDTRRLIPLALELHHKLEPLRERGTLRAELREAIPEPRRAEFDALVDGYWAAVRAEAPRGKRFARIIEERARLFGKQVERSFQRQERSGDIAVAYVLSRLDLPPEREAQVREIVAQHNAGLGPEGPTEADHARLFVKVAAHLNAEQRAQLIKVLRGQ